MSTLIGQIATGRALVRLVLCGITIAGAGCERSKTQTVVPIRADCESSFVAEDSYKARLLEYSSQSNTLTVKASANPKHRVIMSSTFHCRSGQLLYGTWMMESASAKAELHFLDAERDTMLRMDTGMNSVIPLPSGKVLVETAALKQSDLDPSLGDFSAHEGARDFPPPAPDQHYRLEDLPILGQTYIEDVILDPVSRKEIRRIRGPLGRMELRDGEIIVYDTIDQSVYEFDPQTGRRIRIYDYRPAYEYGVPITQLPFPTYYFASNHTLYAVAGAQKDSDSSGFLPSNRLYRYDVNERQWVKVFSYDFEPKWATIDQGRIIAIGDSIITVYDTKTQQTDTKRIPFGAYAPSSLARIGSHWALAMLSQIPEGAKQSSAEAQVWIVTGDFSRVLLKYPMKDFGRFSLTSSATPTRPRNW